MIEFNYKKEKCFIDSDYKEDHIYKFIKKSLNFYEIKLLIEIENMNIEGNYIDIGANIGNHSIFFSKFCKTKKVYSIEIEPKIFNILEKNIKLNNLTDKCKCIKIAISNREGKISTSNIDEKNIGKTKIIDFSSGDINSNTIDNIFKDDIISLIKIDIEGSELFAIEGSINTIKKNNPVLVVECQTKDDFLKIDEYLKELGYETNKINYSSTPTFIWTHKKIDLN